MFMKVAMKNLLQQQSSVESEAVYQHEISKNKVEYSSFQDSWRLCLVILASDQPAQRSSC
jgi:hypothetical protein